MRRISVWKSPTTAPSKCARSSIKPPPPKADAWPLVSSSAYQRVPSPKSPDWAGPYANGRTHSTPTSTPAEPATHRTEAINGHYRTRQTHRQRLPQPHQLPTPNAPHRRRPRRLHPHSTLKSQLSAQLHVGGLLAPIGLSVTIAAMGPSANHTTRTLIREELFNHTAYEIQIAVMFVPAATSFLRLSFPPVVTSTLCA